MPYIYRERERERERERGAGGRGRGASLVAQTVKCLPTMWETRVRSLGWEDPLEKEMATHSSTLAWKILQAEELGRLQSMGSQRVRHDCASALPFSFLLLLLSCVQDSLQPCGVQQARLPCSSQSQR